MTTFSIEKWFAYDAIATPGCPRLRSTVALCAAPARPPPPQTTPTDPVHRLPPPTGPPNTPSSDRPCVGPSARLSITCIVRGTIKYRRVYSTTLFDGSFHPEHSRLADLDDYQRLVLVNHSCREYPDRDGYRSCFNAYGIDRDYAKYCGELSKKIRLIESCFGLDRRSLDWIKMGNRAWYQALKIAAGFSPYECWFSSHCVYRLQMEACR